MAGLAFAADDLANALELLRHPLVGGHDVVERIGYFSKQAVVFAAHPDGEVAGAHRTERLQKVLQLDGRRCVRSVVLRLARTLSRRDAVGSFLIGECRLIHQRLPNNPHSSGAAHAPEAK